MRDCIPGSEIGTKKQVIAKGAQLVLSKIDARNGAFGILPDEYNSAIITGNFWAFDVDSKLLESQYFDYLTKTPLFIDFCIRASDGTTNRRYLQEPKFLTMKSPLPSLEEQRSLVARIEELAGKIQEARSLRHQALEETKAFVTSLHLSLAAENIVRLDEIIALDEHQEEVIFGKQYVQVGVKGFGGGLFAKEAVDATQTTYKVFNRLYNGVFVLSQVKGWEGAVAVCLSDLAGKYVSPEHRTFSCIPGQAIPEYLAILVATPWFWTQLKHLTRGMGGRRERTRPEQFLQMELPMPTIEKQKQAIPIFHKVDAMKRLRENAIAELDALLPSILDKAFKGELL